MQRTNAWSEAGHQPDRDEQAIDRVGLYERSCAWQHQVEQSWRTEHDCRKGTTERQLRRARKAGMCLL